MKTIPLFKPKISPLSLLPVYKRIISRQPLAGLDNNLIAKFHQNLYKNGLTNHHQSLPCSNGTVALYLILSYYKPKLVISQSYTYKAITNVCNLFNYKLEYCKSTYTGKHFFPPKLADLYSKVKLSGFNNDEIVIVLAPIHGIHIPEEYLITLRQSLPNVKIVLDKAQGLSQDDSLANASTYSFIQNKEVSSGEGGAISSNDPEVIKFLKDKINQNGPEGFNFRLSNLNLEMLAYELNNHKKYVKQRIKLLKYYDKQITNKSSSGIVYYPEIDTSVYGYRTMFPIVLNNRFNVQKIHNYLNEHNITSRYYEDLLDGSKNIILLPFYLGISKKDINYIFHHFKLSLFI